MSGVKLKINGEKDFSTNHPLITFGRRADNNVLLDDTNVSQYHARIEQREDGYWIIDQGSSNGTTVNGNPVEPEMLLEDGDIILFGNTSQVQFNLEGVEKEEEADLSDEAAAPVETKTEEEKKGSSTLMMVAGGVVGLAVITVVVVGLVFWSGGGKCEATVTIRGVENRDEINKSTDITADVQQKTPCVGEVVFLLDGKEFGRAKSAPYKATLEEDKFAGKVDGLDHQLKVILLDKKGETIPQSSEIALAFNTLETPTPTPETTQTPTGQPTPKQTGPGGPKVIETQDMIRNLLKNDFPNAPGYKLNQDFLIAVNKKTADYVSEGFYTRASKYKDIINVAFVAERNLAPSLGYILAMSRSKFNNQKQGENEGLWQISPVVLAANGVDLNLICGTETLSDDAQACSAKVSALYLNAIISNVFEGDIIYAIAAIGLPPQEADTFKRTLPANRDDFWTAIKSPKQREQVVNFFAAGIVAENPDRFGLKKDLPISKLFPILK